MLASTTSAKFFFFIGIRSPSWADAGVVDQHLDGAPVLLLLAERVGRRRFGVGHARHCTSKSSSGALVPRWLTATEVACVREGMGDGQPISVPCGDEHDLLMCDFLPVDRRAGAY